MTTPERDIAAIRKRHVKYVCSCGGRRWSEDENWQQDDPRNPVERTKHDGLIPCGFCNPGGWDTPENEPNPTCDECYQPWPCDVAVLLSSPDGHSTGSVLDPVAGDGLRERIEARRPEYDPANAGQYEHGIEDAYRAVLALLDAAPLSSPVEPPPGLRELTEALRVLRAEGRTTLREAAECKRSGFGLGGGSRSGYECTCGRKERQAVVDRALTLLPTQASDSKETE